MLIYLSPALGSGGGGASTVAGRSLASMRSFRTGIVCRRDSRIDPKSPPSRRPP